MQSKDSHCSGARSWEGQILIDDKVATKRDGKQETVESSRDGEEDQSSCVISRGSHEAQLIHGWNSGNEAGGQTACSGGCRLRGDVFFRTKIATSKRRRQNTG